MKPSDPGQAAAEDLLASYDFPLPEELIAQRPAVSRDAARLFFLRGNFGAEHLRFTDLPSLLHPGDVLVRNDTKVFPARLFGSRSGGGKTEFLLIYSLSAHSQPDDAAIRPEYRSVSGRVVWVALARPGNALREGRTVLCDGGVTATILQKLGEGRVVVAFDAASDAALLAHLERQGQVPLPPYISREGQGGPDADDTSRYQTLYAKAPGAVAAPTAGLHFTPAVEEQLRARGVEIVHLTLHVGPGTFRPIKAERLDDHRMDAEYYEIPDTTLRAVQAARAEGRRVIAVGTTSARSLESAALHEPWQPRGWTRLFIRPGFRFKAIDGLITNFHLPKSSLLVLVSSLMGREQMLAAYREAVEKRYRFYSYGDAMLLLP